MPYCICLFILSRHICYVLFSKMPHLTNPFHCITYYTGHFFHMPYLANPFSPSAILYLPYVLSCHICYVFLFRMPYFRCLLFYSAVSVMSFCLVFLVLSVILVYMPYCTCLFVPPCHIVPFFYFILPYL
jgi:hypothetical protein